MYCRQLKSSQFRRKMLSAHLVAQLKHARMEIALGTYDFKKDKRKAIVKAIAFLTFALRGHHV